MKISPDIE